MSTTNNHSELLDQLTDGIANLTTTEQWQKYLDCQSRFHSYSFNNVLLIAAQRHEATRVAGFHSWLKLNRFVRKGEKALWIIAPMIYKNSTNDEEPNETTHTIRGFKYVPVFDIAQTDGEDLPTICNKLTGDDPAGCYAQLTDVARSLGFSVEDAELHGSTNGDCSFALHRIRVEVTNTPAQRVKTLAHELAHALLHETEQDRALAELEAESTAFIVCNVMGIDSSDYSFGYVAGWSGGGESAITGIRASGERIQKTAAAILQKLDVRREVAA